MGVLSVKVREAFEHLGVTVSATPDEVLSAWRDMARRLHPDTGSGNAYAFDQARRAYDVARTAAAVCPTCLGVATLSRVENFATVKRRCPACRGSGRR